MGGSQSTRGLVPTESHPVMHRVFTAWSLAQVWLARDRVRELTPRFALTKPMFCDAFLFKPGDPETDAVYGLFDTGRGVIDAYELLSAACLYSQGPFTEKVRLIFALYDFDGSERISRDELTVLMKTVSRAISRMCGSPEPSLATLESLVDDAMGAAADITLATLDEWAGRKADLLDFVGTISGDARAQLFVVLEKSDTVVAVLDFPSFAALKAASLADVRAQLARRIEAGRLPQQFAFLRGGRGVRREAEPRRASVDCFPFMVRGSPGVHHLPRPRPADFESALAFRAVNDQLVATRPFAYRNGATPILTFARDVAELQPVYRSPYRRHWRVARTWAGDWLPHQPRLRAPDREALRRELARRRAALPAPELVVKSARGGIVASFPSAEAKAAAVEQAEAQARRRAAKDRELARTKTMADTSARLQAMRLQEHVDGFTAGAVDDSNTVVTSGTATVVVAPDNSALATRFGAFDGARFRCNEAFQHQPFYFSEQDEDGEAADLEAQAQAAIDAVIAGRRDAALQRRAVIPRFDSVIDLGLREVEVVPVLLVRPLAPAANDDGARLRALVRADEAAGVAALLDSFRSQAPVDEHDDLGLTALHTAASAGSAPVVQLLLRARAEPDRVDRRRQTPLHMAAARNHEEAVRALIAGGASLAATDAAGATPLHLSLYATLRLRAGPSRAGKAVADQLVGSGAPLDSVDEYGHAARELLYTAFPDLATASRSGDLMTVQSLLLADRFPDVNAPLAELGRTALHEAAEQGHAAVAKHLLLNGASVGCVDWRGQSPLHYACERGHDDVVRQLAGNAEADVNARDAAGRTPLHCALLRRRERTALLLLSLAGADVRRDAQDLEGHSPVHLAAALGLPDALRELLRLGWDADLAEATVTLRARASPLGRLHLLGEPCKRPPSGPATDDLPPPRDDAMEERSWVVPCRTPLACAIAGAAAGPARHRERCAECLHALLDAGADPDRRSECGRAPAELVAQSSAPPAVAAEWVEALVAAGANVAACADPASGWTPLMHACQRAVTDKDGDELVQALAAFAPDAVDAEGVSALCILASEPAAAGLVQLLLPSNKGLDGHPDGHDATPLGVAAGLGHLELCEALLAAGAAPDAPSRGLRPLHWAAQGGHAPVVERLLQAAGVEPEADAPGEPGLLPLHSALLGAPQQRSESFAATVRLLASSNAKAPGGAWTPLHMALQKGYLPEARALVDLDPGASAEPDVAGWQPLHYAAAAGDDALVERLLALGADANAELELAAGGGAKWGPAFLAARHGHAAVLARLLVAGATVDSLGLAHVRGERYQTQWLYNVATWRPRVFATEAARRLRAAPPAAPDAYVHRVVRHALLRGSGCFFENEVHQERRRGDFGATDKQEHGAGWRNSSAFFAAECPSKPAALLVQLVNLWVGGVNDGRHGPVLREAALRGHAPAVELLLATGADVDGPDHWGDTPLSAASRAGRADMAAALLQRHGACVDGAAGAQGHVSPLVEAVRHGHAAVVDLLMGAGADVNVGGGALRAAAEALAPDVLERVIDAGALPPPDGILVALQAALAQGAELPAVSEALAAAARRAERCARLLLDAGTNVVTLTSGSQESALDLAAALGLWDLVRDLAARGVPAGVRAAFCAARAGEAALLRSFPAAITQAPWQGQSPLVAPARLGHLDVVALLLARGIPEAQLAELIEEKEPPPPVVVLAGAGSVPGSPVKASPGRTLQKQPSSVEGSPTERHRRRVGMLAPVPMAAVAAAGDRTASVAVAKVVRHDKVKSWRALCFDGAVALLRPAQSLSAARPAEVPETDSVDDEQDDEHGETLAQWSNPLALIGGHLAEAPKVAVNELLRLYMRALNEGTSVLHAACAHGSLASVQLLLRERAEPNTEASDGATPLSAAAFRGSEAAVAALLAAGADPRRGRHVPLAEAAARGHESVVRLLLRAGRCDVDAAGSDGSTALQRACECGWFATVSALLEHGAAPVAGCLLTLLASPRAAALPAVTVALQARGEEAQRAALALVEAGSALTGRVADGRPLLQVATDLGYWDVAMAALARGCPVPRKIAARARSPLHNAVLCGHVEALSRMLALGVDAGAVDATGGTALHAAARMRAPLPLLSALLLPLNARDDCDEVLNKADDFGRTALHVACRTGALDVVRALAQIGAGLERRCKAGRTPAADAAVSGQLPCLRYLLAERRLDVSTRDHRGDSMVVAAARRAQRESVLYLLTLATDAARNMAVRSVDGQTLLHFAASHGDGELTAYLLRHRVPVNDVDRRGFSALHYARAYGHLAVAQQLLRGGAEPGLVSLGAQPSSKGGRRLSAMQLALALDAEQPAVWPSVGADQPLPGTGFAFGDEEVVSYAAASGRGGFLAADFGSVGWLRSVLSSAAAGEGAGAGAGEARVSFSVRDWQPRDGSLLHYACRTGNLPLVRALLSGGDNVDRADRRGATPLLHAVCGGHLRIAQALVETGGAGVDVAGAGLPGLRAGVTPTLYAAHRGHETLALYLLAHGGTSGDASDGSATPLLHTACALGMPRLAAHLLARTGGALALSLVHEGLTPMAHAFAMGRLDIVELLLRSGAPLRPEELRLAPSAKWLRWLEQAHGPAVAKHEKAVAASYVRLAGRPRADTHLRPAFVLGVDPETGEDIVDESVVGLDDGQLVAVARAAALAQVRGRARGAVGGGGGGGGRGGKGRADVYSF